jgi:hypothetical protein
MISKRRKRLGRENECLAERDGLLGREEELEGAHSLFRKLFVENTEHFGLVAMNHVLRRK